MLMAKTAAQLTAEIDGDNSVGVSGWEWGSGSVSGWVVGGGGMGGLGLDVLCFAA